MSKKLKRARDSIFHGLVSEGTAGCSVLRVVHFDVSDLGVSFLRHNGEETEFLPFSVMRVRKAAGGRKGAAFQGKAQFPILYVKDPRSLEAIRSRASSRVEQQLTALTPKQRTAADSLRLAAGGIVMAVAMLWAVPSI